MKTVLLRFGVVLPFASISPAAFAEIDKGGVLNEVSDRFLTESSNWATTITDHASWLFWTLVVISMVWTFGMMALRKADIGEFFAEFTRFTITTGFFWWLLINGPGFAMDFINSLRNIAANVLLALVTAWIIAYAGIFVLGFGGSRWTSDIAVNYFRSVAGIALKIMTMTLLVGIAVSIIDGYHSDLSEGAPMDELLVIFVVSLVMVILVNSVPNVVAGLIPGGGAAASAGSSFSAGALIGGAVGAGAAVASGGAALGSAAMSGATNMAGGASAVKAAFQKAQSSMAGGDMPSFGGSSSDTGESWGGSTTGSDNASTGDTPFAQAAGFSGAGSSSSGGGFGRAASLAAGTAGELAKGVGAKIAGSFQDKANQTAGGRLASSIRESMEPKSDNDAGSADQVGDTASFDSDSLSGDSGGGWVNQSGGFDALSSEDQDKARQSHAEWQARDPEKHTFDVGDYVSYAQERQQERNEEVASFVNRDRQDT